ncbi:MAG: integral rane sensor signal transduction histidine kinase [Marmoricola sp.]|nr:integral rane sensor signal transduction histidine kinase [Marmoricola sp.]
MDSMTDEQSDHDTTRELPGVASWAVLSRTKDAAVDAGPGPRRVVLTVAVGALVALVAVGVLGILAARALAERQSVNDAANTVDLLSEAVVQPALRNDIATGEPVAVARLGAALKDYLSTSSLVRVKLWTRDGQIIYSDEPRLIGARFALDTEEIGVFTHPRTKAEISDLDEPENRFERGQGKLLEAYRPVWTPNGTPLLFETYSPYTEVDQRTGQLWRGFAGVTISSLLLFTALMIPLLWQLMTRIRTAQRQRESLLQRAVDAGVDERQRIAGTLHDGVVQELAGASFAVSGAASRAESHGDDQLAGDLRDAAGTLRMSIGGLRTLLVDIYPETLETAGLLEVLRDLAGTLRSRDIAVHLDLPGADPQLGPEQDRLVFRIAHECVQNVRRHSGAKNVWIALAQVGSATVLEIADDGIGFDTEAVLAEPEEGHFGLRLLADVAGRAGAELAVSSTPGAGCRWRLTLP